MFQTFGSGTRDEITHVYMFSASCFYIQRSNSIFAGCCFGQNKNLKQLLSETGYAMYRFVKRLNMYSLEAETKYLTTMIRTRSSYWGRGVHSNLDTGKSYPEVLRGFPLPLQAEIVPQIMTLLLRSRPFQISPSFKAGYNLLTESLNKQKQTKSQDMILSQFQPPPSSKHTPLSTVQCYF